MRKVNLITGEISLCNNCGCITNDILGSDGIYCGKCKSEKEYSMFLQEERDDRFVNCEVGEQ